MPTRHESKLAKGPKVPKSEAAATGDEAPTRKS